MTSYKISQALYCLFNNYKYILFNAFVFKWESDFFAISNSGYVAEIEIKISRADFKNDFNKTVWNGTLKHDYLVDKTKILKPHKFFFAFPKGLIKHDEIPIKYGIIEMNDYSAKITRNAKFLHKTDLFSNNRFLLQLLKKFYYRNIDLRNEMGLRDYDVKYKQMRI